MIVANIIVKLPKAIKSRKMQLSNIELYLTFHAHVSALDQLYSSKGIDIVSMTIVG